MKFQVLFILLFSFSGFCYESPRESFCSLEKGVIRGKNIHKKMRIASLSKVFTSFWALKKWGKDFQYKTRFFLNQEGTLYIQGARDPYFLEHGLFYLMAELNKMGVNKLERVIFDSNFYFHFHRDKEKILRKLRIYFNTNQWKKRVLGNSKNIQTQYREVRSLVKERLKENWPSLIQLSVKKISLGSWDIEPKKKYTLWVLPSAKLPYYLKILNAYSNNMTSDEILRQLGGIKKFNSFLNDDLKLGLSFYTGSGLNQGEGQRRLDNEASCFQVLEMVKKFRHFLEKEGLTPLELFPMAQKDVGTLSERFKNWSYINSFVFKTGTLKKKPTSALLAMGIGKNVNFLTLSQGGKSYEKLKKEERQKIDDMLRGSSFRGEKRRYEPKTFLMFERILKKTHFRY